MSPSSRYVWILDNGHGSDTPGKRSPIWPDGSRMMEFEFNRAIVRRLADHLASMGIEHRILVPEDLDVPLDDRCHRANRINAESRARGIVLSIHANAADSPQARGWEVWTSPGETDSDQVARALYDAAAHDLEDWPMRTDWSDGDPDKESRFTILTHTVCPAVLTENGFMTSYRDCQYLLSDEGRDTIAALHLRAILAVEEIGL